MSSDRVEARRPGQSTRRTRSVRGGHLHGAAPPLRPGGTLLPVAYASEMFFGLDVQVPRSKASGVSLEGRASRTGR